MVVCRRRKTCFVGSSPYPTIPEVEDDLETPTRNVRERRDSVESSGSGGSEATETKQSLWMRNGPEADLLEGKFTLISNNNYDKFLAAVGAGPLSSNMVLRARINLNIKQVFIKLY